MKKSLPLFAVLFLLFSACQNEVTKKRAKPNVIIIMTDDQGYGDFGFTGNPHVKTPVLDNLAATSTRFTDFYVSPVCAPTRSSLMTGRQSLRTGVRDTYNGGAIMHTDEITIAELLKTLDYKTGIFGKWHLGDNYPTRPMDQGFEESLTHLGGGMGQVGDFTTYFKFDSSYFNPVLWHNGKQEGYEGYCSDIFAENAIDFITENKDNPFFCYLAFNAPHTPLQLPQKYYDMYKDVDPSLGFQNDETASHMTEQNKEDARKVYGMVSNIDDNIGLLLKKLDELGIADNTLLIFMTDNGPQQRRYVGGMRGRKTDVYRGGVRVPMLMRYPNGIAAKKDIQATAVHMDIMPTLAEVCGFDIPKDRKIDGRSLWPLITQNDAEWPERSLFQYWTRRYPELYNNMALLKGNHRLVGMTDFDAHIADFELYDYRNDNSEQKNLVGENVSLAKELKIELDKQLADLISSKHLNDEFKTIIGSTHENPTILNRNDAGGERGIWAQEEIFGKWDVELNPGKYTVTFKFIKPVASGTLFLEVGSHVFKKKIDSESTDFIVLEDIILPQMKCEIVPFYMTGSRRVFPFYLAFEKLD